MAKWVETNGFTTGPVSEVFKDTNELNQVDHDVETSSCMKHNDPTTALHYTGLPQYLECENS